MQSRASADNSFLFSLEICTSNTSSRRTASPGTGKCPRRFHTLDSASRVSHFNVSNLFWRLNTFLPRSLAVAQDNPTLVFLKIFAFEQNTLIFSCALFPRLPIGFQNFHR